MHAVVTQWCGIYRFKTGGEEAIRSSEKHFSEYCFSQKYKGLLLTSWMACVANHCTFLTVHPLLDYSEFDMPGVLHVCVTHCIPSSNPCHWGWRMEPKHDAGDTDIWHSWNCRMLKYLMEATMLKHSYREMQAAREESIIAFLLQRNKLQGNFNNVYSSWLM